MKNKYSIIYVVLGIIIVICVVMSVKEISTHNTGKNNKLVTQETEKEYDTENQENIENESNVFSPVQSNATVILDDDTSIDSQYAILIDVNDEQIIASKNGNERMYPASMTKVMTILVAADNLSDEELSKPVEVTIDATDYAFINDCSAAGFLAGEQITVADLLYGVILPSGGEAAYQIAVLTSGSLDEFVLAMNQKAVELGISETTHFSNPVGIYDDNNYCTAYDMAVIMKAAMDNEVCREILSARSYTTSVTEQHPNGITFSSKFLNRADRKLEVGNISGAKTGYVNQSRYCAVSSYQAESGKNYICVTGSSGKSWQTVYDHITVYQEYAD